VTVDRHGAGAGGDDAAYDADQRGLAGAVGAQQREDLALADLEIDVLERLQTRGVGLGQVEIDSAGAMNATLAQLAAAIGPPNRCA
jgi:hypothetical protein